MSSHQIEHACTHGATTQTLRSAAIAILYACILVELTETGPMDRGHCSYRYGQDLAAWWTRCAYD
jgi:hypothetical protein